MSMFCGRLLSYIDNYYCEFIKTDYDVQLDMSMENVIKELQESTSFDELSPQLQNVARQCAEYYGIEN